MSLLINYFKKKGFNDLPDDLVSWGEDDEGDDEEDEAGEDYD